MIAVYIIKERIGHFLQSISIKAILINKGC